MWSTGGNWSGGAPPGSTDVALFDATCTSNCSPTFNAAVDVGGIRMATGYTGTITQSDSYDIWVRTGHFALISGTFLGSTMSTRNLDFDKGSFTKVGGTFRFAGGTTTFSKNYRMIDSTGVTIPTGSTLRYYCHWNAPHQCPATEDNVFLPGTLSYENIYFRLYRVYLDFQSGLMKVEKNMVVNGYSNTASITNATFEVKGDLSTIDEVGALRGNSIMRLIGNPSGQTISSNGQRLGNLVIDAGLNPVTLSGNVPVIGYKILSAGSFTSTGSTLNILRETNLTEFLTELDFGDFEYNNLLIAGSGFDLNYSEPIINGTLTLNGYSTPNASQLNNATFFCKGNVTVGAHGARGTASIRIVGNPAGQTLTGNSSTTNGIRTLPNLVIDAGTNPVTLSGFLGVFPNYTYLSSGTFTTTGSTLVIVDPSNGTSTNVVRPGAVTYNNVDIVSNTKHWSLNGETFKIAGSLRFVQDHPGGSTNYRTINNGTLEVGGNVLVRLHNDTGSRGLSGNAVIKMTGNASGQTVLGGNNNDSYLPILELATGANNVTHSGVTNLHNGFRLVSVGTFSQSGRLRLRCTGKAIASPQAPCNGTGGTFDLQLGGIVNLGDLDLVTDNSYFDLSGATLDVRHLTLIAVNLPGQVNNGHIRVSGDLLYDQMGMQGDLTLEFVGSASRTLRANSTNLTSGNWTIAKTGGATLTLLSNIPLSNLGQDLNIVSGTVLMNGFSLSVQDQLTLESGTEISTGGGSLTYGALVNNGGVINP